MQTVSDKKQGKMLHFALRSSYFESRLQERAETAAKEFCSLTRYYASFRILFLLLAALEGFSFVLFFPFLTQSTIFAFTLAAFFLTIFSYFVLRFYFESKKPEEMEKIQEEFVAGCKMLSSSNDPKEISNALYHLTTLIEEKAQSFYATFKKRPSFAPVFEKFSIWMHWKDLHLMKEKLLTRAVKEHLAGVKKEPCDPETHAHLAAAYVSLAHIYQAPEQPMAWTPSDFSSLAMQNSFATYAAKAIEEFKIIDHFAPNQPWVHLQLASLYHDLSDLERESSEYEILLKMDPENCDILFRLAILYFQQGQTAKALRLYEQIKKLKDPRADELIAFYDSDTGN